MGRRERPVDPQAGPVQEFAWALRQLRAAVGSPGYRELARRAGYSASALSAAASGVGLPSLPVTLAYVEACAGDRQEWQARWQVVSGLLSGTDPAPVRRDTVRPTNSRWRHGPALVHPGGVPEPAVLPTLSASLRQHVPGLVLAVLAPGPVPGDMVEEALRAGGVDMSPDAVHSALHRLARAGLVDRAPSGIVRNTSAGYAALDWYRTFWRDFAETVSTIVAADEGRRVTIVRPSW